MLFRSILGQGGTEEDLKINKNMKQAKKEFLPEFTTPVTAIIKEAVNTHTWPEKYKKEYHLPLKKTQSPKNENDVRCIGLTSFVSKQIERFVLN